MATDQLALPHESTAAPRPIATRPEPAKSLYEAVEALERRMFQEALNASCGNKLNAAQSLGPEPAGVCSRS